MNHLEIFLVALFASIAGLNVLARWLSVPYPIPLLVGGLILGLIPGVPRIELNPDLVLLIFLPVLLYSDAFFADLRALRDDARVISLMAIGLVLVTTVAVAEIGHAALDLTWPISFALGAIVAPTDPIAATAIMRNLGAPRRLVNIIEGESLVNDATALVTYKVAIAAALGAGFSIWHAGLQFLGTAAGGVAVGLVVAYVVGELRERVNDPLTEMAISILTAYAAFIPADALGVSGVLASVTAGVYLGWRAPELASPDVRLQLFAIWDVVTFIVNAVLFLLIGLQLPIVMDGLEGVSAGELIGDAALVCAAVIGVRIVWGFTTPYVIRALDRRPQQRTRRVGWRERFVASWSGMRGAVSLAAALALPLHTDAGAPLPGRALVLFLTFAVIVVTLLGEGLTLPVLIRKLGVREDGTAEEAEEVRGRLVASRAALERLDELRAEDWVRDETADRVRQLYEFRQRRFKVRAGKLEDSDGIEDRSLAYQRLMHEIYGAQRQALVALRNGGEISNDVMHRIEREIDLEESRLEV